MRTTIRVLLWTAASTLGLSGCSDKSYSGDSYHDNSFAVATQDCNLVFGDVPTEAVSYNETLDQISAALEFWMEGEDCFTEPSPDESSSSGGVIQITLGEDYADPPLELAAMSISDPLLSADEVGVAEISCQGASKLARGTSAQCGCEATVAGNDFFEFVPLIGFEFTRE